MNQLPKVRKSDYRSLRNSHGGTNMKIGVSTYSLFKALKSGEMDIFGVIDWIADQGGEHVEIVPLGFDLAGNFELADQIRLKAQSRGMEISNYAIGANFLTDSE